MSITKAGNADQNLRTVVKNNHYHKIKISDLLSVNNTVVKQLNIS